MLSRKQPGQFPQITVPVELEKWPPIRSTTAKPKTTRASRMLMMPLICMIVPPAGSRQPSAASPDMPLISTNLLPKALQGHFRHMNSSDTSKRGGALGSEPAGGRRVPAAYSTLVGAFLLARRESRAAYAGGRSAKESPAGAGPGREVASLAISSLLLDSRSATPCRGAGYVAFGG